MNLIENTEVCIDEHHADQLMVYMALAEGKSSINTIKPISGHIKGMVHILNKFIPDLDIDVSENDNSTTISIDGIGHKY